MVEFILGFLFGGLLLGSVVAGILKGIIRERYELLIECIAIDAQDILDNYKDVFLDNDYEGEGQYAVKRLQEIIDEAKEYAE